MFPTATVSSRSSSSRSSCGRNSSMPSLGPSGLAPPGLAPRTSVNPLFRPDQPITSFDASHFMSRQGGGARRLRRFRSHEEQPITDSVDITSHASVSPEGTGDRKDIPEREYREVRDFLDRYSLPRVVRIQQTQQNGVTLGGEPLLLYRCFDNFTKVQARPIGKKGKQESRVMQFPEGYPGWFSLLTDKGDRSAMLHSSLLHLVREQVCSFLSCSSFTAYTAHADPTTSVPHTQYVRTVVRGGQVFRLRAVFQHRDRPDSNSGRHSTRSGKMGRQTRDKDLANRYAQLIDVNNQELYAPLTTKGEFYEVHSSTKARLCFPGLLDKTGPLALDKDCLYRLAHLLRRVHLPLKVKLMSGPQLPKDFPDTFILEEKFQEPLLVTCTLPRPGENVGHQINCLNINSKLKICRSMLGFDSEYKLFKSQRLQSALSHCHKNVEQWYRQVRLVPNIKTEQKKEEDFCLNCRKLKKICGGKCNEHRNDEEVKRYTETNERQLITKEVLEKFPKPKKWYRHFKILGSNTESTAGKFVEPDVESCEKVRSIDRYKDMSKLIEEKFGKKQYNPVKKSASFMFSTKRIDLEETPMKNKGDPSLLKCQSLDAQLCLADAANIRNIRAGKKRGSDVSDSFSHEFQMCILENEKGFINDSSKHQGHSLKDLRSLNMVITEIDLDEIKPVPENPLPTKPDLIPSQNEHSFITERLCSEFHVKTKIQKKPIKKQPIQEIQKLEPKEVHVVQVHQTTKVQNRALPVVDDLPYSQVVDEVSQQSKTESENVYAEICDSKTRCDCSSERCGCKRRTDAEYCYVKLGSNGDSITQSSDDDLEAIYNTLR